MAINSRYKGLDHTINLDEIALQLMNHPEVNDSPAQETVSIDLETEEVYTLSHSMSGLLITHERSEFADILDSLVDESVVTLDSSDEGAPRLRGAPTLQQLSHQFRRWPHQVYSSVCVSCSLVVSLRLLSCLLL